jgi:hypothetical protein
MGAEVPPSGWIKLVVTVKAYPSISKKHGEAICVAGIRTDTPRPRWCRLWPIAFRDLPFSQRFQKYQEITLKVLAASDPRPETLRPQPDTLKLGKVLPTKRGWAARRRLVEPLLAESMCEIARRQQTDSTSLGVFRPAEVERLTIRPDTTKWDEAQLAAMGQVSLFAPVKNELKRVPYKFQYRYRCSDRSCPGHEQTIIDWELGQAWLGWTRYDETERLEMIRRKWHDELCGPDRDTYFFVGNMHLHPQSFLVLGVFWPPHETEANPAQLPLGLD